MRVAIIGTGLFGCTAAIHAARHGYNVTLFDKSLDIMTGATKVNQFRLHQGYHYPRSDETVTECGASLDGFLREYGDAVISHDSHYYAIANGSKTSADDYVAFMDRHGLTWKEADLTSPLFNASNLEAVFRVAESRIDPHKLKSIVLQKLDRAGVGVQFNAPAYAGMRDEYDKIIIAGYAGTNEIAAALGCNRITLQYELVEKPVIRLPSQYRNISCVVMDGPYGCVDPVGNGLHLMGHVSEAIRTTWLGNSGINVDSAPSKYQAMIDALSAYLPFVAQAELVEKQFVTRVVLPNVDATDARPTIVTRLDDQVIRIFSGKLGHAVKAASDSLTMLEERAAA